MVTNWDGQWYRSISETGYPASLTADGGVVGQNEWAFYPAYPALVRLIMGVGFSFAKAATLVSVLASALAIILMFRLISEFSRFTAVAATLALCTFPTSPVLQVAYSESLALFFIAFGLWSLTHAKYSWFAVASLALALTRPIAIALAGVGLVYWAMRWARRRHVSFGASERWKLGASVAVGALSMGLWPLIASLVTGEKGAYAKVQAAWAVNNGPHGLWGNWIVSAVAPFNPFMLILVLAALAYLGVIATARRWENLGPTLRLWSVVYPLYLLLATRPGPSILRHLLLSTGALWPFPGPESEPYMRHRRWLSWILLGTLTCTYLVGQYIWTVHVFAIQVTPEEQPYP